MVLLIGDELIKVVTDINATAVVKVKPTIKIIQKRGFVVVDTEKL